MTIDGSIIFAQRLREEFDADPNTVGKQSRANETDDR